VKPTCSGSSTECRWSEGAGDSGRRGPSPILEPHSEEPPDGYRAYLTMFPDHVSKMLERAGPGAVPESPDWANGIRLDRFAELTVREQAARPRCPRAAFVTTRGAQPDPHSPTQRVRGRAGTLSV
jgi:hypothetical protein